MSFQPEELKESNPDIEIEEGTRYIKSYKLPHNLGFKVKKIEPIFEEGVRVTEGTVKSLVNIVRSGKSVNTALGYLNIEKEDLENMAESLKEKMRKLIEEATLDAKDRQRLSRAVTNKIVVEATENKDYGTALEALELMNRDPEVDIQPRLSNLPISGLISGEMMELFGKMSSGNETKLVEGEVIDVVEEEEEEESNDSVNNPLEQKEETEKETEKEGISNGNSKDDGEDRSKEGTGTTGE